MITPSLSWWRHKNAAFILVLIASVLAIGSLGLAERRAIRNAFVLATTHQPEAYSELYLDNNTQLPTSAPANTKQLFAFHLSNHEGRITTYRYQVVMDTGEQAITVSTGSITLADGANVDTPVQFVVPGPKLQPTITVKLVGRPEAVRFRTQS